MSGSSALAITSKQDFVVLDGSQADSVQEILTSNLDGERLTLGRLDFIRMPSQGGLQWAIPNPNGSGTINVDSFDAVILTRSRPRTLWLGQIGTVPAGTPPDCRSRDSVTGFAPETSDVAWAGSSNSCHGCPYADWSEDAPFGRRPNGSAWCRQNQQYLVLMPGDILPTVVQVPSTSFKGITDYNFFLTKRRIQHDTVVTRFKLERAMSKNNMPYAVLRMEVVPDSRFDEHEVQQMRAYTQVITELMAYRPRDDEHALEAVGAPAQDDDLIEL